MPNLRQATTHPCTSCAAHFLHLPPCSPGPVSTPSKPGKRNVFTLDPIPDN